MASFGFGLVAFFRTLQQADANPEVIRLHEAAIQLGTARGCDVFTSFMSRSRDGSA